MELTRKVLRLADGVVIRLGAEDILRGELVLDLPTALVLRDRLTSAVRAAFERQRNIAIEKSQQSQMAAAL